MALILKDFTEIKELGKGGMGEVFTATQVSQKRKVVLKKMAQSWFANRNQLEQFEHEAKLAASLDHDNIIQIYDFGKENGEEYFAMEYIDGSDMEKLFAQKPFPREIGLMIALQALKGLNHAHQKGLIHGDFKPNNILVSKAGKVKITDFGLAQVSSQELSGPNESTRFITPAYMSPEAAGRIAEIELSHDALLETTKVTTKSMSARENPEIESRSISGDIWSAGVLLHRILCGKLPFSGETIYDLAQSIINSREPDFLKCMPFLPDDCAQIISACLAKKPQNRPLSLGPLIKSLEFLISDIGFRDINKEIQKFMTDKNSAVYELEKVLLIYHASMASKCWALGDAEKASAHFAEFNKLERNGNGTSQTDFISAGEGNSSSILNNSKTLRKTRATFLTPKALKIFFASSLIFFACMGIGISLAMLHNKRLSGDEERVYAQKTVVPQTSQVSAMPGPAIPPSAAPIRVADAAPIPPIQSKSAKEQGPDQTSSGKGSGLANIVVKPVMKPLPAKSAILKVRIIPSNSFVILDGKDVPTQEITKGKRVASGPHLIIAWAFGFEPYQATHRIEPGATQVIDVSLTKDEKGTGFLHVYSYPWADLYVDGLFQGTTPTPKPLSFTEGEHALLLKRDGYKPFSETIRISKGQVTHIQSDLEKIQVAGK